jgi:transcriptional regulator with XRE-family HTH domain
VVDVGHPISDVPASAEAGWPGACRSPSVDGLHGYVEVIRQSPGGKDLADGIDQSAGLMVIRTRVQHITIMTQSRSECNVGRDALMHLWTPTVHQMSESPLPSEVFPGRLAEIRGRKRWSQRKLAEEMTSRGDGSVMDQGTISRIEAGRRLVTLDELFWFAWTLGVSPVTLLFPWEGKDELAVTPGVARKSQELIDWYRGIDHLILGNDYETLRFFREQLPNTEAAAEMRLPGVLDLVQQVAYVVRLVGWVEDYDQSTKEATVRALERLIDEARDLKRKASRKAD